MAGFGNTMENDILSLLLNNVGIANLGDATGVRGSTSGGSVYLALHTADPGEAGDQSTSEVSYGGYARIALARDGTRWTVSGGVATLVNEAAFPAASSGSATATHLSVGTSASGAGKIIVFGSFIGNGAISTGLTPRFAAGTITLTLD